MTTVKLTQKPGDAAPLDPAFEARMDAMTPEQIEQNAHDDPDNPPMTEEEADRIIAARRLRLTRMRLGMTQGAFASTYRITLGRLRDIEQGRTSPELAFIAYLDVIAAMPTAVKDVIAMAEAQRAETRQQWEELEARRAEVVRRRAGEAA